MRIVISNKFYYPKGGDCVHAIELEKLLVSKGHEVAFFAIQHPQNLPSAYSGYFPSEIDYASKNIGGLTSKIIRPFGSGEVKSKFRKLLVDFKPDVVHVNNIHSHLSPIIVQEAYNFNIPVIWTLHDYKLLCPRYDCLRDNIPCELCYTNKTNVVRHRCMKGSLPASILSYLEAKVWDAATLQKYTSCFICPSEFMHQKMRLGGFTDDKLVTLNNFKDLASLGSTLEDKQGYYCFVGRLSVEKGIETLLKAAIKLPGYKLKIIGSGPLLETLRKQYSESHIEFCGQRSAAEVRALVGAAAFTVLPSEWYENNPLAIIESLCMGTPVLGARMGGIPELIDEETNGLLFSSGDHTDLVNKIEYLFSNMLARANSKKIADAARARYSSDTYYEQLLSIYQKYS